MNYDNVNTNDIDEEGFNAFFAAHPNDATVVEETPAGTDGAEAPEEETPDVGATNDAGQPDQDTDQDSNAEPGDQEPPAPAKEVNPKQAQAFAQMRIQNQQQQQLIRQIAEVVGIQDTKDPNAVVGALQQLAIKAQSQKQGIPEDVLARLNQLESVNQEYQKQQAYLAAGRGFQTIKDKFELEDSDLETFAQELIADGINPYERPIDLVSEYRNKHFDKLMEQAIQKGMEQEAKRAAKAGAQGSTPTSTKGARAESEPPKINSVSELNKWLEENK